MYARNLKSTLVAVPYRRKGVETPEMSRLRLIFVVVYGALYWVALELPLWMCWAFFLSLSVAAFIADQSIPSTPFTLVYVGIPLVYGWMFTAGFTMFLTALRTLLLIVRLALRLIKALRS